jgi:hypothetical protein
LDHIENNILVPHMAASSNEYKFWLEETIEELVRMKEGFEEWA